MAMGRRTGRRGFFGRRKESGLQVLPYRIRDNFLSPEQASYFKMILSAVGDIFAVCPGVYLADIISVTQQDEADHFMERLNGIQIDFLICDRDTLLPLAAVVLSGKLKQPMICGSGIFWMMYLRRRNCPWFFYRKPLQPWRFAGMPSGGGRISQAKPLDGRYPANWTELEKTAPEAPEEKFKPWQQPDQDYQEGEYQAEEPLLEAALKLEESQPEPETVEKTHQEIERYEPVLEENSAPVSTWMPPLKQPLEDLRQPQAEFTPLEEATPPETAGNSSKKSLRRRPEKLNRYTVLLCSAFCILSRSRRPVLTFLPAP